MRKILLITGVILASVIILLVGMHLYQESSNTTCPDGCTPFHGTAVREGDNLLLVVRHVPCAPTACNPCGANADSIRGVNISIIPDNGRQFFVEQPVKLHEVNTITGVLANRPNATISVLVSYAGWKNQSCSLGVVDTRV
jgi:hypothetical protein